jgi:hypothetical protein
MYTYTHAWTGYTLSYTHCPAASCIELQQVTRPDPTHSTYCRWMEGAGLHRDWLTAPCPPLICSAAVHMAPPVLETVLIVSVSWIFFNFRQASITRCRMVCSVVRMKQCWWNRVCEKVTHSGTPDVFRAHRRIRWNIERKKGCLLPAPNTRITSNYLIYECAQFSGG